MSPDYVATLGLILTILFALRERARRRAARRGAAPAARVDALSSAAEALHRLHRIPSLAMAALVVVVVGIVALTNELAAWILSGTATLGVLIYQVARRSPTQSTLPSGVAPIEPK